MKIAWEIHGDGPTKVLVCFCPLLDLPMAVLLRIESSRILQSKRELFSFVLLTIHGFF